MVEDLKRRSYRFGLDIIKLTGKIEVKRQHLRLLDQLLRSGTSIGANIIEGRAASSQRELIRFYEISLRSANETKYWLCLIRDGINPMESVDEIKRLLQEADELSKILGASIVKLKQKAKKVTRNHEAVDSPMNN